MAKRKAPLKGDDSTRYAGTEGRGEVYGMVPGDLPRALAIARRIQDPWFRCQSLAMVARYLDDQARERVLTEAFAAADEQTQPNRIVTVASWPLEVLADLGPHDRLARETRRLLLVISTEPHNLRRADALAAVLNRVWAVEDVRDTVMPPFLAACVAGHGWRRDRLLRYAAQRLAATDPPAARAIVALIEEDKIRRRSQREVDAATVATP